MMRPSESIRTKLRVVILVTSLTMILVTSISFVAYEYFSSRRTLLEYINTLAKITAANCTPGLAFQNVGDAREVLNALALDRYVVEAALYDANGKIFARFPSEYAPEVFPATPPLPGTRFEGGGLIGSVRVVQDSKPLGTLYLKSDIEPLRERFRLHTLILAGVLIGSGLVAWVLSGWLGRRIASPILALARTARSVSQGRNYETRATKNSADEVGDLTDAFNHMLDQIQERESTLRENAERLQLALEASQTGSWDWNMLTGRITWDDYLHPLFGLKPGEFKGTFEAFEELIHPEDRAKAEQNIRRALKERREFSMTYRVVWPDGSIHHIASRGKPIFDAAGKPIRLTGVSLDVTESQKAEQALRESEERFRTMANAAPVLIWTSNVKKQADYFNKSWLDFTGRSFDQELGAGWAQGVHPDDLDDVLKTFNDSHDRRVPFEMQFRMRRADGDYRWVIDHGVPRFSPDGAFQGFIGSCLDITDRKLAQAELERRVRERTAELAEANRELESFTYSVSHDLRAPLRHIQGYADILREDYAKELPADAQHLLSRVTQGSHNMGRLVDDLLRLARIGRQELDLKPTDLNAFVKAVIDELSSDLAERKITWKIDKLPTVMADPGLLQSVYTNLINNAAKYSRTRPESIIEIGQTSTPEGPAFFVRDNGVGFDMKFANKLFGVFQRLHRQEQFEGTGVGLAIVDRVIRKHGGRIWAESAPDKGATFYFTLGKS
jgi:PAS domain S-box-containing protein